MIDRIKKIKGELFMKQQMNKIESEELMNVVATLLKDELICSLSQEGVQIRLCMLNGQKTLHRRKRVNG